MNFLKYVLGIGSMIGLYYFIRLMILGFGDQFGNGFFFGLMFMLILVWIAYKIDPKGFYRR